MTSEARGRLVAQLPLIQDSAVSLNAIYQYGCLNMQLFKWSPTEKPDYVGLLLFSFPYFFFQSSEFYEILYEEKIYFSMLNYI